MMTKLFKRILRYISLHIELGIRHKTYVVKVTRQPFSLPSFVKGEFGFPKIGIKFVFLKRTDTKRLNRVRYDIYSLKTYRTVANDCYIEGH